MKKREKQGFTLTEILIVVAIIGVLVAVSIPIFVSRLEETRRSVCLANRRGAKMLITSMLLSGDEEAVITDGENWDNAYADLEAAGYHTDQAICPKGGTIIIHRDGMSISLTCSEHGGSGSSGDGQGTQRDYLSGEKNAEDLLKQVSVSFVPPNHNTGTEKAYWNAYLAAAQENGGLKTITASEVLEKFDDPSKGFYQAGANDDLLWVGVRTFFDGGPQDILVVTSTERAKPGNPQGLLFYYNGNYYRTTKTAWNGSYDYSWLINSASDQNITLEDFLAKNGWELAP